METIQELHKAHVDLQSDIQFHTKEINFLLHLIIKETKKNASTYNLKLLNAYSEVLEGFKAKISLLHKEILLHEKNLWQFYYNLAVLFLFRRMGKTW